MQYFDVNNKKLIINKNKLDIYNYFRKEIYIYIYIHKIEFNTIYYYNI